MMTITIRFCIILLSFACCCHLRELCSSYFTFSFPKRSREDSEPISEFKAETELTCALRCSTKGNCDEVIFNRDSKKCSLYQKEKGSSEPYAGDDNTTSRILKMRKVTIRTNNKNNRDCPSSNNKSKENTLADKGKDKIRGTSCSDILQKNGSSPTGHYHITIGNVTWKTRCRMNSSPGCGHGVWELVMRINGSMNTFSYGSPHWTSKVPYPQSALGQGNEIKLPGYWLSNFIRICVTMDFSTNAPSNATSILLNYTAPPLHSAIHSGMKKTWAADLSTIKTPPNIDKSCLVQGFNLRGPYPWVIKSRIGVESQPLNWCPSPYLVRGVGISFQGHPEISCGDFIVGKANLRVDAYPAFCRVYIQ